MKSEYKPSITFEFILFIATSPLGVILTYKEIDIIYRAISSNSVDSLIFEFVKYESGTITQGYSALLQHLAMLIIGLMLIILAVNSLRKILFILKNNNR